MFALHRVSHHCLIFTGTDDDAYSRVVRRAPSQFVVHACIHIYLADILWHQLAGFEIDQHEALEQVIVENEVELKVSALGAEVLCRPTKTKSLPHYSRNA